jgi:hypothetical protein
MKDYEHHLYQCLQTATVPCEGDPAGYKESPNYREDMKSCQRMLRICSLVIVLGQYPDIANKIRNRY